MIIMLVVIIMMVVIIIIIAITNKQSDKTSPAPKTITSKQINK